MSFVLEIFISLITKIPINIEAANKPLSVEDMQLIRKNIALWPVWGV